ncbi:hypothetical protein MVEN_01868000 [Mycena venus]|uniref:DUF202 domain-containing protein n=1 Tax=Mycena venus TaxID=2733690 RepID=A0A8H6XIW1_9AGAR|nr:hypothetical protein MVEN_01868000 [Mycena venus]
MSLLSPTATPPAHSIPPSSEHTPLLFRQASKQVDVNSNPKSPSRDTPPIENGTPGEQRPLVSRGASSTSSATRGKHQQRQQSLDRPQIRGVSLVLENSGSTARDHLASERTFLAYVRTSLTIAAAGIALAQLLTLSSRVGNPKSVPLKPIEAYARPLAAFSIILALYVLAVGVSRYFAVQAALTNGLFSPTRFRLGIIALSLAGIIVVLFGLLVEGRKDPR